MVKTRYWVLVAVVVFLVGCATLSGKPPPAPAPSEVRGYGGDSGREYYLELGRETYERVCASCHEEGKEGAPAKGDRDAWSNRSPLWAAVLLEHAKSGFLKMPARGGNEDLSDRAVEAAGEYMLGETFPELLGD